jgi:hypothetical protein
MAVNVEEMTGAGYFTRRADERYLQALAFCQCVALKKDRQSVAILRHQRRLPPPPASLVQKIGERIFVLTRMTRQLYHHSLVFFHQGLEIMTA